MTNESKRLKKNGGFKFKFTVIMAVYNVSPYIDEAIESIINQTVGFKENIQLILSDDGSLDDSGVKCDKYKEMYPDNVVVIHKENGGPGSARNAALPYIEGRYVNFMDPDDTISKGTFKGVYRFFKRNEHKTDYVAIPMYFFEGANGPHHLNNKFKRGNRVINLLKDHSALQYSEASAFIKHHVAKKQHFNEKLVVAEDAQQIMRILVDKPYLGVYKSGRYNYRKRMDSLVNTGTKKKGWYLDYLKNFSYDAYNYAMEKFGYVPKFVQNTIMGDLRWRFSESTLPSPLTEEETKEYKSLLFGLVDKLDEDIIFNQTNFMTEIKAHILSRRYENFKQIKDGDIVYGSKELDWKFSDNILQVSYFDIRGKNIVVGARVSLMPCDINSFENIYITVGKEQFTGRYLSDTIRRNSIGDTVAVWKQFEFILPYKSVIKNRAVRFVVKIDGLTIKSKGLFPGNSVPATNYFRFAYYYKKGLMIRLKKDRILVYRTIAPEMWLREILYRFELLFSNWTGAKKAFLARCYAGLQRMKKRKPLWLITDRLNKAGDNGEAFFNYLIETKFDKADFIFAISDCEDYKRLKAQYKDKIVLFGTNSYKLKFLNVDKIISSHAENFILDPFDGYSEPYRDLIKTKDYIFLQHGVTKDDLSSWLNRFNKNIRGFISAAPKEWESIVNGNYLLPEENVWLTGFSRFDRLYNDEKKYITVMPTWRKYLMGKIDKNTGRWTLGQGFTESNYYKFFNSLINDERIISTAEKCGYTLCFMPHPNTITSIDNFKKDPRVKFFSINDSYRKVFAESNLIVTDYSSAVFDFVYMKKPVFYAQFDQEEFYKGEHAYVPGYFDYERDGFGEVVYDYESTVSLLCEYIEKGCVLKDKYKERIENFFAFNDKNNCKRILDKILELDK